MQALNSFEIIPTATPTLSPVKTAKKQLFAEGDIQTLVQAGVIPSDCPHAQIQVFAKICNDAGLSPFRRQVCLIGVWSKDIGANKYSTMITNEGLRSLVNRNGCYAGCDDTTFNNGLSWYEMQNQIDSKGIDTLKTCTFTGYYFVKGAKQKFTKTVSFKEFSSGKLKWVSMPLQMIEKVAKSFCYKEMIGDEASGFVTDAEIDAVQDNTIGQPQPQTLNVEPKSDKETEMLRDAERTVDFCVSKAGVQIAIADFKKRWKLETLETVPSVYAIFNAHYKALKV